MWRGGYRKYRYNIENPFNRYWYIVFLDAEISGMSSLCIFYLIKGEWREKVSFVLLCFHHCLKEITSDGSCPISSGSFSVAVSGPVRTGSANAAPGKIVHCSTLVSSYVIFLPESRPPPPAAVSHGCVSWNNIFFTCQLTLVLRFSTTTRYSVRVGGPYLSSQGALHTNNSSFKKWLGRLRSTWRRRWESGL